MTSAELARRLSGRKCCQTVVERVLRLNPNGVPEGSRPRGIYRRKRMGWRFGYVGKGEFIRRFGRTAWDMIPPCEIFRQGRRKYVALEAVQDSIWMVSKSHEMRNWRRTRRGELVPVAPTHKT